MVKGKQREREMDGECSIERHRSRRAVPDEIVNPRAPLHCLKGDIAQRVHGEVQREIAEHDEAADEAKPPKRHLVA